MSNPKITDGSLYKLIRKALPLTVNATNPKDADKATMLELLVNSSDELHHAALGIAKCTPTKKGSDE